jgi:hypothetical protein
MFRPPALLAVLFGFAATTVTSTSRAQAAGLDWRHLVHADLRLVGEVQWPHAELWADKLAANNDHYARLGDRRFAGGNAPAVAAGFVVRSPERVVMLSLLNTVSQCRTLQADARLRIAIRRCPMRLAIYETAGDKKTGGQVLDAGSACVLEHADPARALAPDREAGAYAAYDPVSRSIRLGVILSGRAVPGCDLAVPVPRQGGRRVP